MYGYTERLTAQEIKNLLGRGENITPLVDVPGVDLPNTGQWPKKTPLLKRLAKGVVSTVFAVHGAYTDPAQSGDTTQHKWSEGRMESESRRHGDDAGDATRDKGYHDRDSGQWF
jgi:hypothetical protein